MNGCRLDAAGLKNQEDPPVQSLLWDFNDESGDCKGLSI